jgi:hypothetical protein
MPERQRLSGRPLQKGIIDTARRLGWRVAHTPPVLTKHGWRTAVAADGKGFPDLLLVRERAMVIEVKGDGDKLTKEQQVWLTAFRLAGIEAHVGTPQLWLDGTIEEWLRVRRRTSAPLTEEVAIAAS